MLPGLVICVVAALVAFAAAWLVGRNAVRLGLVQAPNARSSHTVPTPSGGGIGIALGGAIATLYAAPLVPGPALATLVASLALAAIGLWDDRRPLRPALRLAAQAVLWGGVILWAAPGLAGPLLLPLLLVAGVYWINLFNFMDGIDGLAGVEAAFLLLGGAALALFSEPALLADPRLAWMAGVAAATLGFLVLNWPPARIFMGDVGSTYLGLMISALALLTVAWGWLDLWQWLILAALFVTDASVTLVRRLLGGARVFEAHRGHAYQVLARRWRSHRRVTLLYLATNVIWLLPLALWAGAGAPGWLAAFVAYAPLVALALVAGAGAPETRTAT